MAQRINRARIAVLASLQIGWRQARHSWRLLLLTGAGMLVALLLALFVPLYAYQSLEGGLLAAIARSNVNPAFAAQSTNLAISTDIGVDQVFQAADGYEQTDQLLQQIVTQQVGSYVLPQVAHAVQLSPLDLHTLSPGGAEQLLSITGTASAEVAPALTLLQGRLPHDVPTAAGTPDQPLEAALPDSVANELHLTIGSRITIPLQVVNIINNPGPNTLNFTIQVVGVFKTPVGSTAPFFEQNRFLIERFPSSTGPGVAEYPIMVPLQNLIATLQSPFVIGALLSVKATYSFTWLYQPDLAHFTIDNLNDVASRFAQLPDAINQNLAQNAQEQFTVASTLIGQTSPLQVYDAQVHVAGVPITILLLDIMGILLFFITLIAELLIGGQATTIAQLRSRGISRLQIFGGYLLQSVGLGVGALAVAIALFLPLTTLVVPHLVTKFAPSLTFVQQLGQGWWYALGVCGFAILTLWLCIGLALQSDLLAVRREASRNDRPPLWQRLHLDLTLGVVLLVSFGLATYALQSATDPQTATMLVPLSLVAPTFLVLAGMLFILRGLPWLFRRIARLAARRRGAVAFLACLQLARTPQTLLRLLLVFALTIAFMVYVFVFSASQTARVQDLAAQEVGADIIGYTNTANDNSSAAAITQRFMTLPQVRSATVGLQDEGNPIVASGVTLVDVIALDCATYQQTAVWPGQTSPQTLHDLLANLIAQRANATSADAVPALVNAATWNAFHLTPGAVFHLALSGYGGNQSMKFVALAEVPTIPSVAATQAAVLTDYQTFSQVRQHDTNLPSITPYIVWLRLQPNVTSHAALDAAFATQQTSLTNYTDRPAIQAQLLSDPLATIIVRILLIGLALPLVLALIGNLIAIWTQLRQQNVMLALARALGMAPTQIRNLLIWEMGLMQGLALLLGVIFGGILAFALTPALIFSTTTPDQLISPQSFFALQSVLPVRVVLPPAVLVALGAFLVLAGIIVTVGVANLRRRAISQALRLNED